MGYSAKERADLQATINRASAEVVVAGTPSNLSHVLALDKAVVAARYGSPRWASLHWAG
jgi:predicted GTPase